LLENLMVIVIAGSDGELRVACSAIKTVESVTVISFEDGSPLLSGNADENAHSSSSTTGAACGVGTCAWLKSNKEADAEGCWGVDCRRGVVMAAKGSMLGFGADWAATCC
jgi:hypothetical protein